jgi:hypothetical protein
MGDSDQPGRQPGNVTPISRPGRESRETDRSRGTRSRHVYADEAGHCTHPDRLDTWFCHRPSHQHPGLCHLRAGWGTEHLGVGPCKLHGGLLGNVDAAARLELARARAERDLAVLNTAPDPIDNPLQALADLAGETRRWTDVLGAHVAELTDLRYQVRASVTCPECATTWTPEHPVGGTEQIRGEVILYERALAHLGRLLVAIGRLNIDDRLARIDERLTDMVVRAVDAGLKEAGVRPDNMDTVRYLVGEHLRRHAV